MKIEETPLSVRAINALSLAGYDTIEKCKTLTEKDLYKIKNLGKKTVSEILHYFRGFPQQRDLFQLESHQSQELSSEKIEYLASVLPIAISDIFLSVRARNTLGQMKIEFVRDLVTASASRILKVKNSGKKTLSEILDVLGKLDLRLAMTLQPNLVMEVKRRIAITKNAGSSLQTFKKKYPTKKHVFDEIKTKIISQPKMDRYMRLYELYKKGGTLEYVGKEVGLTRERVRQILVKGTKYGLFEYKGHEYPYVSKEKVIDSIVKCGSLLQAAKKNTISTVYLNRLLVSYQITRDKVDELIKIGQKNKTIEEFNQIKSQLGHDPNSTELQSTTKWRYIEVKIRRLWGSIFNFRQELKIPSPPPFKEAVRPWIEHRTRLALIKRMQDLDNVREVLEENGPLQTQQVAVHCRVIPMRAFKLLKILVTTGEAVVEGVGSSTRYKILKNGEKSDENSHKDTSSD